MYSIVIFRRNGNKVSNVTVLALNIVGLCIGVAAASLKLCKNDYDKTIELKHDQASSITTDEFKWMASGMSAKKVSSEPVTSLLTQSSLLTSLIPANDIESNTPVDPKPKSLSEKKSTKWFHWTYGIEVGLVVYLVFLNVFLLLKDYGTFD